MRAAWWASVGLAGLGAAFLARYGYGQIVTERQEARYRTYWRRFPDVIPATAVHYVALGDSTAQGIGASRVQNGYVPLIADRLAAATGRPVVVTNLSSSGAGVRDVVREQLPLLEELPRPADLVTLGIGSNDVLGPGSNPISFEKHFSDVLAALPRGSFVADVPWFATQPLAGRSAELASVARSLIGTHGHHLVRLHAVMRCDGPYRLFRRLAWDLVHPNDAGHKDWAEIFWNAIAGSGWLARPQFREVGGLG